MGKYLPQKSPEHNAQHVVIWSLSVVVLQKGAAKGCLFAAQGWHKMRVHGRSKRWGNGGGEPSGCAKGEGARGREEGRHTKAVSSEASRSAGL